MPSSVCLPYFHLSIGAKLDELVYTKYRANVSETRPSAPSTSAYTAFPLPVAFKAQSPRKRTKLPSLIRMPPDVAFITNLPSSECPESKSVYSPSRSRNPKLTRPALKILTSHHALNSETTLAGTTKEKVANGESPTYSFTDDLVSADPFAPPSPGANPYWSYPHPSTPYSHCSYPVWRDTASVLPEPERQTRMSAWGSLTLPRPTYHGDRPYDGLPLSLRRAPISSSSPAPCQAELAEEAMLADRLLRRLDSLSRRCAGAPQIQRRNSR